MLSDFTNNWVFFHHSARWRSKHDVRMTHAQLMEIPNLYITLCLLYMCFSLYYLKRNYITCHLICLFSSIICKFISPCMSLCLQWVTSNTSYGKIITSILMRHANLLLFNYCLWSVCICFLKIYTMTPNESADSSITQRKRCKRSISKETEYPK